MELLRILHWAAGAECRSNPRMQRDLSDCIRNLEVYRAIQETLRGGHGQARSADDETMRKAQKSYYYMRPQNHGQRSVDRPHRVSFYLLFVLCPGQMVFFRFVALDSLTNIHGVCNCGVFLNLESV
ncbi:hypothetical protein LIPSTDRAFT_163577 [Lipomyces starkeyi NRRL Y-11557]|uniref:Uncharacterized protein n=1 Tax=Lipomyces starkeyi NRRL Y-11557 TaxID=675824 RepID=A0A1E3Q053_LIPST|nr:hypothetical protein LIPSTDRAFT_163577 [Lipomyces starkeyi NRRL Y-11557]